MYFRQFSKGYYDLQGNGNQTLVTSMMYLVARDQKIQHLNTLAHQNIIGLYYLQIISQMHIMIGL